ncbi:LytR/AlgR family response regulator transcription factor [Aquimarina macrocephali]|uniref:LytR/AlgR family response regulator transcription factor n=1 Tax=Aquimarina macrocephali TaxID=666563 RepID=UPI0004663D48|nr:LytTR family DNA-binding domain-containing protein [Aquimarina macrocephali]
MKVLIIEDEVSASKLLVQLLNEINPEIEVVKVLDSVKSSIVYLKTHDDFELIMMDVQLGDGICFEIFKEVKITQPIIFTTAYDQYAIEAFKVNSIYYILKPLKKEELNNALLKYKNSKVDTQAIFQQMELLFKRAKNVSENYTSTFLIPSKSGLVPLKVENFSFFHIEMNIVRGVTFSNKSYILDKTISELEEELNPQLFYRANRQLLVNRNAIGRVYHYLYGKLKISTQPEFKEPIIISKAKSKIFKSWLTTH